MSNLSWDNLTQFGSTSLWIAVASIVLGILVYLLQRPSCAAVKTLNRSRGNARSNDDSYEITKCPNPNCARCNRYAELNRSARRRLPWIGDESNKDLARIRSAILSGPDVTDDEGSTRLPTPSTHAITSTCNKAEHMSPVAGQRPNVLLIRGLKTRPVVTELHQDACRVLEDFGKDVMLKEYRRAMESHLANALENDVRTGMWKVLHLLNQGMWIKPNVDLCPKTAEAVQSMQGIMDGCIFGNIFTSVLYPGTFVDPHCGPTNIRHRLHFPLVVPVTSALQLRVANEKITWTEGESVIFDDSIVHAAAYPEDELGDSSSLKEDGGNDARDLRRIVLIVDLWHPDLSVAERKAICNLYPAAKFT